MLIQPSLYLGPRFTPEALLQSTIRRKLQRQRNENPEALPVRYKRGPLGYLLKRNQPIPIPIDYELRRVSLAKDSARGLRKDSSKVEAITEAYGEQIILAYRDAETKPDIIIGREWYQIARTKIKEHFGDDALLFAQLLAATSARTNAKENYRQALEAYNQLKSGAWDIMTGRYLRALPALKSGHLKFRRTFGPYNQGEQVTQKSFREYLDSEEMLPRQSNGKKFSTNSYHVLNVIAGIWMEKVGGPKTPNFAGNLAGQTLEATIDVWIARGLRRMGSEGLCERWRILPEAEKGVSDRDFFLGQAAFRYAADRVGVNPDDLQAVLWFYEKKLHSERGWTKGQGAELADFGRMLAGTIQRDGKKVILAPRDEMQQLFAL